MPVWHGTEIRNPHNKQNASCATWIIILIAMNSCLSGTYWWNFMGPPNFCGPQPFLQASETPRAPRTARPPFGPRPVADHCDADGRHCRSLVWRPSPAAVLWTCWQLTPLRKDVGQHNLCSVHGWKTSAAKNHPDLRRPVVHQKCAERDPLGRSSRSLGWYEPVRQHMVSEVEAKADWRPPGRTSDLSGSLWRWSTVVTRQRY